MAQSRSIILPRALSGTKKHTEKQRWTGRTVISHALTTRAMVRIPLTPQLMSLRKANFILPLLSRGNETTLPPPLFLKTTSPCPRPPPSQIWSNYRKRAKRRNGSSGAGNLSVHPTQKGEQSDKRQTDRRLVESINTESSLKPPPFRFKTRLHPAQTCGRATT